MRRLLLVGMVAGLAFGAMSVPAQARKTPEQKDWLARQKAQPLTFTLPAAEAGAAWLRAKTWIATNAKVGIQIADENLIQTEGDGAVDIYSSSRPRLTITRIQGENGEWTFSVSGRGSGPSKVEQKNSLQALAFHVASGEPYPDKE